MYSHAISINFHCHIFNSTTVPQDTHIQQITAIYVSRSVPTYKTHEHPRQLTGGPTSIWAP